LLVCSPAAWAGPGERPRAETAVTRAITGVSEGCGELLRRYRVAAGLSQEELAERAGLSAHGISDLERGARRVPYPDTVHRLALALELSDEEAARLRTAARRTPAGSGVVEEVSPTASGPEAPHAVGSLPTPLTSFVGRERESAAVSGCCCVSPSPDAW
jgi:transcriptional regulator with XRE-family HTH domain